MFSFGRTLEILMFSLCNFGPYVAFTYYIFQKHFRYSKITTGIVCTLLFFFSLPPDIGQHYKASIPTLI